MVKKLIQMVKKSKRMKHCLKLLEIRSKEKYSILNTKEEQLTKTMTIYSFHLDIHLLYNNNKFKKKQLKKIKMIIILVLTF